MRNRAILWVFYNTGIRISELCGLRLADFDRKRGVLTVKGKGSKEHRAMPHHLIGRLHCHERMTGMPRLPSWLLLASLACADPLAP